MGANQTQGEGRQEADDLQGTAAVAERAAHRPRGLEAGYKKQLAVGDTVDVSAVEAQSKGLTETSAGRQLFALVAACRDAGIDPDSALRRHTAGVVAEAERQAPQS